MSYWREAGFSFVRYSALAGQVTRACLREPLRRKAADRDAINMTLAKWLDGKPPLAKDLLTAEKIDAAVMMGSPKGV